jgi:hypothetical protein
MKPLYDKFTMGKHVAAGTARGESEMVNVSMSYDYAVHSDFLVHWSGKDIDADRQRMWEDGNHRSETDPDVDDRYLCRLRDILTYGLWMTDEGERRFGVGPKEITIPSISKCCFTELKLSESRRHAVRYGRLGIGVKRPFVFQRLGRPMAYFGFGEQSNADRFLAACSQELRDPTLLNFFKPMNSDSSRLTYELYAESEWRILFFDALLRSRKIVDPRDKGNAKEHAYFNALTLLQQNTLRYLVPLDGWFAMIIYPSLTVKNHTQCYEKYQIRQQIGKIKSNPNDHGNQVEGLQNPTRGNWPIEVDLDACRHF